MNISISKATAQQIVDTVHDVCSYDVNFIDSKGIIYASTNKQRIGDYHEIGHRVVQTGEVYEVNEDDNYNGTLMGINLPFSYDGKIIGAIGISGQPEIVRKYGYLAQRITRLIFKEQEQNIFISNRKSMLHSAIHALTQGETISADYYQSFLDTFHVDENKFYRCVLVQINERFNPINFSMLENKIYRVFEKTGSNLFTFEYPRNFILLLTEKQWKQMGFLLEKTGEEYEKILKIGIGLSTKFSDINKSFRTAMIAQNSITEDGKTICFDDLALEILTGSIHEEDRRLFLEKTLSHISDTDISLLKTYFSCSCS